MKRQLFTFVTLIFCPILALIFAGAACKDDVQLKTPSNIQYVNDTISWSAVDGATHYIISINGEEHTVTECTFPYDANNTNFSVQVRALPSATGADVEDADNVYKKSAYSSSKTFSFLSLVRNFVMEDGILHWDPVEGADGYIVKHNGVELAPITTNYFTGIVAGASSEIYVKPVKIGNDSMGYFAAYSNQSIINILETPVVQWNKTSTTLSWNSITGASGYKVLIKRNGTSVSEQTLGQYHTTYTYNYTDAGTYQVFVKATIESDTSTFDSKYSNAKEIVRLSSPRTITIDSYKGNAANVIFENIPNATDYNIYVDESLYTQSTRNSFEFISQNNSPNETSYTIRISSHSTADNVLDSLDVHTIEVIQLGVPQNVSLSNRKITWDSVDKADGKYYVNIDGEDFAVTGTEFVLPSISDGAHTYQVRAKGNESNILNSNYTALQSFKKLEKPSGLTINNYTFSWQAQDGASNYIVHIGNESYNTDTNTYTIDSNMITNNLPLKVQAIGNGTDILDSDLSDNYTIYKLPAPIVAINNENITWNPVNHAVKYRLNINSAEHIVTGTSFSWDQITAGSKRITVTAVGDECVYFTSNPSAELTVTKLDAPIITKTSNSFTWSNIPGSESYLTSLNGRNMTINKNQTLEYIPTFTEARVNTFKVRAVGNQLNTVSSSWTSIDHETTALTTPYEQNALTYTRNGSDYTFTINQQIENAVSYTLFINGVTHILEEELTYTQTITTPGTYVITYQANADQFNYVHSGKLASSISFVILAKPSNINLRYEEEDCYAITWQDVTHAVSYSVTITKLNASNQVVGEETTFTTTSTTLSVSTQGGVQSIIIKIKAVGNNVNVYDSQYVEVTKICLGG